MQILRDQLEDFLQPQPHDAAQVFYADFFQLQADFVGDGEGLSLDGLIDQRGAVFDPRLILF